MTPALSLGISPCPNDTYIFEALVNRRIPLPCEFALHMADVEELNAKALAGRLDVTKLSSAAMLHVLDRYVLLNSGGALGRGCGPLLVSKQALSPEDLRQASIAIPGRMTTANSLLSLNGSFTGPRQEMIFDQVIPAVAGGHTDLGVIIHESRFTYQAHGLHLVLDLGEWWERETGLPIPLGVIALRRDLGPETALLVQDAIRLSLEHANARPEDSNTFVSENAQEMEPTVMSEHIATFVNEFSLDLGHEGRSAIRTFLQRLAAANGAVLPDVSLFAGE